MLPFYMNVIGILLTAIVLFASYAWMNAIELQNGTDAIELSSKLRSLQSSSARFYYAKGAYPLSLTDLASETTLPDMGTTGALLALNGNIACLSMTDTADNAHLLGIVQARVQGSVVTDHCGAVSSSGLLYVAVSVDGETTP